MVVAIVILIAVGPGKMPNFMRAVGKGLREFRKASSELRRQAGLDDLMRDPDPVGLKAVRQEIQAPIAAIATGAAAVPAKPSLNPEDRARERSTEGADLEHAQRVAQQAAPLGTENAIEGPIARESLHRAPEPVSEDA